MGLRRTLRSGFIWIACAAWLAAGCGGESQPDEAESTSEAPNAAVASRAASSPAPDVDPCTLLTAADIEGATGKAPGPPRPGDIGIRDCTWDPADGVGPPLANVMVHYGPTPGNTFEEFVDYQLETLGDLTSRENFQEVEGVGDYGVWMGRDQDGLLEVYEGDMWISVTTLAGGGRTARENAVTLAKAVRARLP